MTLGFRISVTIHPYILRCWKYLLMVLIFFTFILQACEDSFDFRDGQCSTYNEYGETEKIWKPYYNPEEPCSLYCVDQNSNVEMLASTVQDGTRCRPGSLDMCIDGRCQVSKLIILKPIE